MTISISTKSELLLTKILSCIFWPNTKSEDIDAVSDVADDVFITVDVDDGVGKVFSGTKHKLELSSLLAVEISYAL